MNYYLVPSMAVGQHGAPDKEIDERAKHKRLGMPRDAAKFARVLNVIYITTAEFPRACHE